MRNILMLLGFPLAVACASGASGPNPDPKPAHVQEGRVVSPTSGLDIGVALASAHLGAESCTRDESADLTPKSCASLPLDAGAPQPKRGTGICGGACDFSSLQIAFTPGSSGQAAHVKVTSASLLDASTGAELQQLSAYTPLAWTGTQYRPWDEIVSPSTALKASYTLAPPAWSTVDTTNSFSRQYKVRLVLEVDGASITLESDALNRDPPVST